MKVDVQLIFKDEIELLPEYLAALEHWSSLEAIVAVDTGSSDGSFDLMMGHRSVQLHACPLDRNFSAVRNYGLAFCTSEWVLQLDADERPSDGLLDWISSFVDSEEAKAVELVSIHRENLVAGHGIGKNTHEQHIRLFRAHRRFQGRIHESLRRGVLERVVVAPPVFLIQHYKTQARQERQNALYELWKE